ncbi:MAG: methyltransferase [Bauldia sp.]
MPTALLDRPPDRTSIDAFLGGRLQAVQPLAGHHRAGLEAVLLAAALESSFSGSVIDLGAGVGVAGLGVAARCARASVVLVERDPVAVACARAALSLPLNRRFADRVSVVAADIAASAVVRAGAGVGRAGAAVVIGHPPFREARANSSSPHPARAAAHVLADGGLEPWVKAAASLLKPRGRLIVIFDASGLDQLVLACRGRFGAFDLLPIQPRPELPASRLLVSAVKGSRAGPRLLPPLVLHGPTGNEFVAAVDAVLRGDIGLGDAHAAWPSWGRR